MKLITLLEKINNRELNELPLKIRYHGKLYTKEGSYFTYYEDGKEKCSTLKIDTIDLDDENYIEVVDDRLYNDDEKSYKICEKMRELINKIDDLIDELDD